MTYNAALNDYEKACNSCTIYIVLLATAFLIITGISSAFYYFLWYFKKGNINTITKSYTYPGTVIY